MVARAGFNLDTLLLSPLTRGASQINVYGSVGGEQSVYRPNALTGDPNHLGIMLLVPLLALTPVYLRNRSPWLAALLGFLLVVELATLSRSGLVGLGVGFLVLLAQYRTELLSRAIAIPLARRGGVRRLDRLAPRRLLPRGDPLAHRDRAMLRRPRTSTSTASSPTCSRRIRSSGSA